MNLDTTILIDNLSFKFLKHLKWQRVKQLEDEDRSIFIREERGYRREETGERNKNIVAEIKCLTN